MKLVTSPQNAPPMEPIVRKNLISISLQPLSIEGEALAFAGMLPHHLDALPRPPTQDLATTKIDARQKAIGLPQRPLGKVKTGR
jgi:hypothetical protein